MRSRNVAQSFADEAKRNREWRVHLKNMLTAALAKPEVGAQIEPALENASGGPVDPTGVRWAADTDAAGNGPVDESWGEVDHDENQSPITGDGRAWLLPN